MWRTLIVLSLLVVSTSQAAELSVKKRFDHRFTGAGWSVFIHRLANKPDQLVAINKKNFAIEVINAANGETLTQDSLDTNALNATRIETLSTSTGELAIAFATQDGRVELHALNSQVSFELERGMEVTSLSMIERKRGEVFLSVTTRGAVEVYRRADTELELIQRISSQSGIQQGKLLLTNRGDVLLQVFDGARKMHLMNIDAEEKNSNEILAFSRPAQRVDGVLSEGTDFITALMDGRNLRFYVDSAKADTATVKADLNLGATGWIKNADGRLLFTAVHHDKTATRLNLYDPYSVEKPIRLGVADARVFTEIGSLGPKGQPLYFYVKDHKNLVLQNENVLVVIPNKTEERIASVQSVSLGNRQRSLAVLLESERGSHLMMIAIK